MCKRGQGRRRTTQRILDALQDALVRALLVQLDLLFDAFHAPRLHGALLLLRLARSLDVQLGLLDREENVVASQLRNRLMSSSNVRKWTRNIVQMSDSMCIQKFE